MRVVAFDSDGPVQDSSPHFFAYANLCCEERGLDFPFRDIEDFRDKLGGGRVEMYQSLGFDYNDPVDHAFVHRVWDDFDIHSRTEPMPGIVSELEKLLGGGFVLAVASGNPVEKLLPWYDRFGLREYFSFFVGTPVDRVRELHKPHPYVLLEVLDHFVVDPVDLVYVGDMVSDAEACFNVADYRGSSPRCVLVPGWNSARRLSGVVGASFVGCTSDLADTIFSL